MSTKTTTENKPVNRVNGHGTFEVESINLPATKGREVSIPAPNFQTAIFHIKGTAPLVIKRFSEKGEIIKTYEKGTEKNKGKKIHAPSNLDDVFNRSRYVSTEGWDGFNASSIRNGLIRVCTLVNFKMTLAKMSLFVKQDGWDAIEPQKPLVRIYGKAVRQDDPARNPSTGAMCVTTRAAYHDWSAKLNIRWDADQFSLQDVSNLLMRVGVQCGIGEGRPFSKESTGMGWGTFEIVNDK